MTTGIDTRVLSRWIEDGMPVYRARVLFRPRKETEARWVDAPALLLSDEEGEDWRERKFTVPYRFGKMGTVFRVEVTRDGELLVAKDVDHNIWPCDSMCLTHYRSWPVKEDA